MTTALTSTVWKSRIALRQQTAYTSPTRETPRTSHDDLSFPTCSSHPSGRWSRQPHLAANGRSTSSVFNITEWARSDRCFRSESRQGGSVYGCRSGTFVRSGGSAWLCAFLVSRGVTHNRAELMKVNTCCLWVRKRSASRKCDTVQR